jgi:phosphoglycerate dehydrogenase-like enzyme
MDGSIVLVIGLGDIGGSFAKRVKTLGAYTIGIRRSDFNKPEYLDELWGMDALRDLLPRADIAALSLPETPLTKKVLNRDTLSRMKQNSVIVNVGRGSAIDTEALCDALEKRQIHGAALDVTDPEPLPPDHRLWKLENAVITPHVSGGYSLKQTQEAVVRISGENIKAYLAGQPLSNVVDFAAGY